MARLLTGSYGRLCLSIPALTLGRYLALPGWISRVHSRLQHVNESPSKRWLRILLSC